MSRPGSFGGFVGQQIPQPTPLLVQFRPDPSARTVVGGHVTDLKPIQSASGYGSHLLVPAGGSQGPTLTTFGTHARPAMAFTAASAQALQTAAWPGGVVAQPITVYLVASSTSVLALLADGIDGVHRVAIAYGDPSSGKLELFCGSSINVTQSLAAGGVICGVANDVSSALYFNGALIASGDAGAEGLAGLTLGASQALTAYTDGVIAEDDIFTGAHDATQVAKVTTFLRSYYGI